MLCVDTSHFSKDEKSLLRGGGLMTQQSGPAQTNTRMADEAKVLPSHYTICILLTWSVLTRFACGKASQMKSGRGTLG